MRSPNQYLLADSTPHSHPRRCPHRAVDDRSRSGTPDEGHGQPPQAFGCALSISYPTHRPKLASRTPEGCSRPGCENCRTKADPAHPPVGERRERKLALAHFHFRLRFRRLRGSEVSRCSAMAGRSSKAAGRSGKEVAVSETPLPAETCTGSKGRYLKLSFLASLTASRSFRHTLSSQADYGLLELFFFLEDKERFRILAAVGSHSPFAVVRRAICFPTRLFRSLLKHPTSRIPPLRSSVTLRRLHPIRAGDVIDYRQAPEAALLGSQSHILVIERSFRSFSLVNSWSNQALSLHPSLLMPILHIRSSYLYPVERSKRLHMFRA